jgi:exodeoxyribonuclease V gamma subunit
MPLRIVQCPELERLAEALAVRLARQRRDPLERLTVVVPQTGLRRWLKRVLAEHLGREGSRIAAGIDLLLPSEWLERSYARLCRTPTPAPPAAATTVLWLDLLGLPAAAALHPRLGVPTEPERRLGLALELERIYTEYALYRPEWLAAWAEGSAADDPQAELWRAFRARHPGPTRSERVQALRAAADRFPLPLPAWFGFVHLPRDLLDLLQALAERHEVEIYFPAPSLAYLGEEPSRAQRRRSGLVADHPWLAAWARLAGDFQHGWYSRGEPSEDLLEPRPPPHTLLGAMQASLHEASLDPLRSVLPERLTDGSLEIWRCSSPLREVEVLKDRLLQRLRADPTLEPGDIVVLSPDPERYRAALAAVFPASPALPYRSAEGATIANSTLQHALAVLIELDRVGLDATGLERLLACPSLRAALGLPPELGLLLRELCAQAGFGGGLDAEELAAIGAGDDPQGSLADAVDRLLASLVLGGERHHDAYGIRALDGDGVQAVAAAVRLLELVRRWRRLWTRGGRLVELAAEASTLLAESFGAEPDDPAYRQWRAGLIELEQAAALLDPAPWPPGLLRAWFRRRLQAPPSEDLGLAVGGVTVAAMLPMRAIPFRVVAVLGLERARFPRSEPQSELHRLRRPEQRRRGDREQRLDDRYQFLEAVLAARDALYLSYGAEDPQDGRPREASAVLDELLDLLDRLLAESGAETSARALLVHTAARLPDHPLHFDPGRPLLQSFAAEYVTCERAPRPWSAWVRADPPAVDAPTWSEFERWVVDPLTWFAEQVLGLGLPRRVGELEDAEAQNTLDHEQRRALLRHLERGLARGRALDELLEVYRWPNPPGAWGRALRARWIAEYRAGFERLAAHEPPLWRSLLQPDPGFPGPLPLRPPYCTSVAPPCQWLRLHPAITSPRARLVFGWRWLVACAGGHALKRWALFDGREMLVLDVEHVLAPDAAAAALDAALEAYAEAHRRLPLYAPRASRALARALENEDRTTALRTAQREFESGYGSADRERPWVAMLLAGAKLFDPDHADAESFIQLAQTLWAPLPEPLRNGSP